MTPRWPPKFTERATCCSSLAEFSPLLLRRNEQAPRWPQEGPNYKTLECPYTRERRHSPQKYTTTEVHDHSPQPKLAQNGPKMAPRWRLGGSWGHLGGKMAPRWSQEGSKVEKVNSFPPCWGPSWDPIFHIFLTRVVHKRLGDPLG